MGALLPIEKLTAKEIKTGVAAVKFIKAMYDLSDSDLEIKTLIASVVDLKLEIAALKEENEKLNKRLDKMTEIMNNNNEHFNDRINKVIQDFKIRVDESVATEKERYERVEVNFDAR